MNLSFATSMPDWLRQRAASTPDRLALLCGGEVLTYRELDARVDIEADRLAGLGVERGSVVAVLSANSTGFVVAVHAVARLGGRLLPLNLRLSAPELAWQLGDAGATHLLHDGGRAEVARELETDVPGLTSPPSPLSLQGEGEPSALRAEARASRASGRAESPASGRRYGGADSPSPRRERGPGGEVHSVVYTSGTTGTPKGAMLTYGNHLWSAVASAMNLGVHANDRWLACLPLFHVGGLAIVLRSVIYGTTAIVHAGFDPARVNAAIERDGVTIVSVVANMLQRMLDERGDAPYPGSLRCVLLGGGPAPEALLRRCETLGVPVVQTYGLTETASQVATLAPEDALRKLGSAGRSLFGSEVRILDEAGTPLAPGLPGEIVVRGPTVTPGYLNRPEASAAAIRDGWLHTGDIGYLDAEGYLYVLDRRDDLIVSGGENVYPAEIEAVLQAHPAVAEAGVMGVPDERWGQKPVAFVVLQPGAETTAEALISHCRERLATYKAPARVEFRDALPRNAAGKLLRRALR